jgi:hypothetical protein
MIKQYFCLASCVMLSACGSRPYSIPHETNLKSYAEVSFHLDVSRELNTQFDGKMFIIGTTQQIRNGPMGMSGTIAGDPDYKVEMIGLCQGAVNDLLPKIEQAAPISWTWFKIVGDYKRTARCVDIPRPQSEIDAILQAEQRASRIKASSSQ